MTLVKKFIGCLLLAIFIGFYASITIFTHSHILNGVTIVHSHPYSSGTSDKPLNHQHSEKGFALIQFLTSFTTAFIAVAFTLNIILSLLYQIIVNFNDNHFLDLSGNCTYSLRAPPLS
jgi:ABC-type microcin C transport system permease subunit YejB